MKPIYIFGHKNPDTDSVASCISLAYLKNELGQKAVPKLIGPLNRETRFVLDYFNVQAPSYMNDVKVQIKDLKYLKNVYVNEYDSINNAFKLMKEHDLTAIPLINDDHKLTGYVTLKDMAKYLISGDKNIFRTNLKHILETLNARIITNFDKEFIGNIKTLSFKSGEILNEIILNNNDIIIIGDHLSAINEAIKKKVKLIILTRGRNIPVKLLNKAINNKVNIITSTYSTFELCSKFMLCNYIHIINDNPYPKTLDIHSYYSDFITLSKKLNYTNYPVVNSKNECVGVLRLYDSNTFDKKRVILVDHNTVEQSIEGIDEAEILEIYDHHNIGNIGTSSPIYFISRPLGSSATLIYDNFIKERIEVPKYIAGLLLSAILSDTLLLTSPTTTELDRKYVLELEKIAGVDYKEYGMKMLKAASSIKGLSVSELISQDFKTYNINDKIYGIAVITSMDFDEINNNINEYVNKLNDMVKYEFESVLIFITDVIKQGSYVIYNDESKNLIMDAFNINFLYEGYFLEGLISRKKQILPAILKTLEK